MSRVLVNTVLLANFGKIGLFFNPISGHTGSFERTSRKKPSIIFGPVRTCIPPNGNAPSINQHLHQLRQRHITSGDNNANPFQFNFRKVPTLGRRVLMRLKKFCECQYASTFPRQNVV